jgi:hypothetical protein
MNNLQMQAWCKYSAGLVRDRCKTSVQLSVQKVVHNRLYIRRFAPCTCTTDLHLHCSQYNQGVGAIQSLQKLPVGRGVEVSV